jgi:hypothetical protein
LAFVRNTVVIAVFAGARLDINEVSDAIVVAVRTTAVARFVTDLIDRTGGWSGATRALPITSLGSVAEQVVMARVPKGPVVLEALSGTVAHILAVAQRRRWVAARCPGPDGRMRTLAEAVATVGGALVTVVRTRPTAWDVVVMARADQAGIRIVTVCVHTATAGRAIRERLVRAVPEKAGITCAFVAIVATCRSVRLIIAFTHAAAAGVGVVAVCVVVRTTG